MSYINTTNRILSINWNYEPSCQLDSKEERDLTLNKMVKELIKRRSELNPIDPKMTYRPIEEIRSRIESFSYDSLTFAAAEVTLFLIGITLLFTSIFLMANAAAFTGLISTGLLLGFFTCPLIMAVDSCLTAKRKSLVLEYLNTYLHPENQPLKPPEAS